MAGLPAWNSNMGDWEIGSTSMCGPAWQPMDIEQLWLPAPNRGTDRVVPGVSGRTAKPRYVDARTVPVRLWLTGAVDQSGSANSDEVEGFAANVATLAALVTPPTSPTVTRTSTLTMPDDTELEAEILVESLEYERVEAFGPLARAVLTITIPGGAHYAP